MSRDNSACLTSYMGISLDELFKSSKTEESSLRYEPEFAEEEKICEETMKVEILTLAKSFRLQSEKMETCRNSLVV